MAQLNRFLDSPHSVSFEPGQVIFERGDPSDFMYGIVSGEVEIRVGTRVVETISSGTVFGEMALIDDEPRSATAIAKTECRVVEVDAPAFHEMIIFHPDFALEVMKIMSQRMRRQLERKDESQ